METSSDHAGRLTKLEEQVEVLESRNTDLAANVERLESELKVHKTRVGELETENKEQAEEIEKYENEEDEVPYVDQHALRSAVPGPYHAVARGEDDCDVLAVERAVFRGSFTGPELDAVSRIIERYKSELHVSGDPGRVYSNASTVEVAVEALNSAIGVR